MGVELGVFGWELSGVIKLNKITQRLALGTVQFGFSYGIANTTGQVMRHEAKEMLKLAAANGIDTLDTAIDYGESEICLGEAGAQDFKILTKLPAVPDGCIDINKWVEEQFATSCDRLNMKGLYGLLLHRPAQLLGPNGKVLYKALQNLKSRGHVQKVGISIYSPSELDTITKHFRLDIVQAPFNLVDRRLQTTGWMQRLLDEGIELHTRSAFLQGLLLMSRTSIPSKFAPWAELWDRWHKWITAHQVSAVMACMAFSLSFPEITRIVVGADSVKQLNEIISAVNYAPDFFPDLQCSSENLINPYYWNSL